MQERGKSRTTVTIRLPEDLSALADEIAEANRTITTKNRIIARAIEIGLPTVARELGHGRNGTRPTSLREVAE